MKNIIFNYLISKPWVPIWVINLLTLGYFSYIFGELGGLSLGERFIKVKCRLSGHPMGVTWFTGPEATDPDMTCRGCGDEL